MDSRIATPILGSLTLDKKLVRESTKVLTHRQTVVAKRWKRSIPAA